RRLVVLVDQFEEVFTLCNDDPIRRAFLANLLHAATVVGGPTLVLLTMRADFLGHCAAYSELAAALSDDQELVGPMTEDELRMAIERPAQLVGCELEPGLTDLLLQDVKGQLGALPLLQYTLLELWQHRQGRRLTIEAYRDLGGVQGALEHRANDVFKGFNDAEREICRRIFLRLVQPGEGSEDTKRRVSFKELVGDTEDDRTRMVRDVIRRLADARLITTKDRDPRTLESDNHAPVAEVEVAHEALIRGWGQLRQWIDADRAGLRTHRQLTEAVLEWQKSSHDPSYLYQGPRLAVAKEWAEAHSDDLNPLEREFLDASEKRHADELATAILTAIRLRNRALGLLIALAATILIAIVAGYQWNEATSQRHKAERQTAVAKKAQRKAVTEAKRAEEQSGIARSRQVAAMSTVELNQHLDRALLLSVAAVELHKPPTLEARRSLLAALNARPKLKTFLHHDNDSVRCVVFSPDGAILAAGFGQGVGVGGVVLWDVAKQQRIGTPLEVGEGDVTSVAFSPDGTALAVGFGTTLAAGFGRVVGDHGGVVLWDVAKHQRIGLPLQVEGIVESMAYSPDGATLAAGFGRVGRVVLWDVAKQQRIGTPLEVDDRVMSVAFSPDGATLAVGFGLGGDTVDGMELWDVAKHQRIGTPLEVGVGYVKCMAFSYDGKILAAGFRGDSCAGVELWDVAKHQRIGTPLEVGEGDVLSVAFSPDGTTLAAGFGFVVGDHCGVVLWDVAKHQRIGTPLEMMGDVLSVAFNPDGATLAAGFG
ncbi:MAG: WD40 repeat domain-containing protein, partial [Isosphaeraceae bacterium]